MRRKYFGLAIAALATLGPMQAWGGDREIAQQIIKRLKVDRESGALKDFTLDMKVDKGVVLFRGSVSQETQKDLVLKAAQGIEGVAGVVDEVSVNAKPTAMVVKPKAPLAVMDASAPQPESGLEDAAVESLTPEAVPAPASRPEVAQTAPARDFSFREALADQARKVGATQSAMPGQIMRTAAVEPSDDAQLVAAVVSALSQAKDQGRLKGFGVDVKSYNGVLQLTGRASSPAQRDTIINIAESVPGVAGVREAIAIPTSSPNLPRLPEPPSLMDVATTPLQPVQSARQSGAVPAQVASTPVGLPAVTAPYRSQGGQVQAMPASIGAPVAGQPVPMAPYSVAGAPRYDTPNMPNYAWPGYAAYPNYAALTYPQQYSPSAWPYIGPFYPYPQVPLGWRKVSLEWDDGWWFLDFTDR